MRKLLSMMVVAVLAAGFTLAYSAEEKTITGMAQCAKCALKEVKSCQNVIVVKEDDKEVNYYLVQNEVAKKAHQKLGFCTAPKGDGPTVKATGDVKEEEGKHVMTASKIEAVEEE